MRSPLSGSRIAAVAIGALATLVACATASASSIVYAKDGNVWLANPDGTGQYQVTLDGTPSDPYKWPSQADDGTIVAQRGTQSNARLHRMKQNGELLNPPIETAAPGSGPIEPVVSPDGTKVAFYFLTMTYPCIGTCAALTKEVLYTYSDRYTDPAVFGEQQSHHDPSWMSNSRVLFFYGTHADYDDLGGGNNSYQEWFKESDYRANPSDWTNLDEGEVTRQGDRLAIVRKNDEAGGELVFYETNGGPPAKPTPRCAFVDPTETFRAPSWSPNGGAIAWAEGDGIWTASAPNLSPCETPPDARLLIPGASDPDWGPADVNPGPRPNPNPNPNPNPDPDPDDKTSPSLSALRVSPVGFRAASSGASVAAAAATGAKVSYRLSEHATVGFAVDRAQRGRKAGGRCVKQTKGNRRKPPCTRYARLGGTFTHDGAAGANGFRFTGRLGGKALKPGSYRLVAVAVDRARNASRVAHASFRIVRR